MIDKIKNTIKKYDMLSYGDSVAVAFSGGADSTALLDILHKSGIKVSAIHVNHMIRGAEADSDEEFCRQFCKARDIPFFCHRIDVPLEAEKSGEGLEEAARRLRYSAIEETVAQEGIAKVATAHHADDNAETVIFNIVRGSGTKGGCGIPPVRDIYIRPLIEVTRDEIVTYCKENSLGYVTDSTNLSTDYTRNFIRLEIMPRLKEINPDAAGAMGRFSDHLRRDNEALEALVPEKSDRNALSALPDAILSRYIRKECHVFNLTPSAPSVEYLIGAIRSGNRYIVTDMGNGVSAVCDRNSVSFRKGITESTHKQFIINDGIFSLDGFGKFLVTCNGDGNGHLTKEYSDFTYLNADRIKGDITVRSRRDGDRYSYCGMTHSLKKLFNSRKIPVEQRANIPLICDESGILWIPGFPPRDDVKSNKKEKNAIYIGYKG